MLQLTESLATGYEPKHTEYISYWRSTASIAKIILQLVVFHQLTILTHGQNLPEHLCHICHRTPQDTATPLPNTYVSAVSMSATRKPSGLEDLIIRERSSFSVEFPYIPAQFNQFVSNSTSVPFVRLSGHCASHESQETSLLIHFSPHKFNSFENKKQNPIGNKKNSSPLLLSHWYLWSLPSLHYLSNSTNNNNNNLEDLFETSLNTPCHQLQRSGYLSPTKNPSNNMDSLISMLSPRSRSQPSPRPQQENEDEDSTNSSQPSTTFVDPETVVIHLDNEAKAICDQYPVIYSLVDELLRFEVATGRITLEQAQATLVTKVITKAMKLNVHVPPPPVPKTISTPVPSLEESLDDASAEGAAKETSKELFAKTLFSPSRTDMKVVYSSDVHIDELSVSRINDGGIGCIGTEVTAFSGYDPMTPGNYWHYDPIKKEKYLIDAYNPDLPSFVMPVHSLMARPFSSKHAAIVRSGIETWPYDKVFFGQAPTNRNMLQVYTLQQFSTNALTHAINTGTVRQFEFIHPSTKELFNILINPYLLTPEEVSNLYEIKYAKADSNDNRNSDFTREWISKCFKTGLLSELRPTLPFNVSGPVLFAHAMWRIHNSSYDVVKANKAKLRAFSLKDFPGENVALMCNAIIERYTLVEALSDVEPDLLVGIGRAFETGTDQRFYVTALGYTKYWKDAAKDLRFSARSSVLSYRDLASGSKQHFDIRTHLRRYSELYNELVQSNLYEPAAKQPAANLLKQRDLQQTKDDVTKKGKHSGADSNNSGKGSDKSGKAPTSLQTPDERKKLMSTHCHMCGQSKTKCPKRNCYKDSKWRSDNKGPFIKRGVFVFAWCTFGCDCYRFHDTKEDHDGYQAAKDKRKDKQPRASLAAINNDSGDDDSDDGAVHGSYLEAVGSG